MSTNNIYIELLLMSTHNICFCGEIRKILCGYPLISRAIVYVPFSRYVMT